MGDSKATGDVVVGAKPPKSRDMHKKVTRTVRKLVKKTRKKPEVKIEKKEIPKKLASADKLLLENIKEIKITKPVADEPVKKNKELIKNVSLQTKKDQKGEKRVDSFRRVRRRIPLRGKVTAKPDTQQESKEVKNILAEADNIIEEAIAIKEGKKYVEELRMIKEKLQMGRSFVNKDAKKDSIVSMLRKAKSTSVAKVERIESIESSKTDDKLKGKPNVLIHVTKEAADKADLVHKPEVKAEIKDTDEKKDKPKKHSTKATTKDTVKKIDIKPPVEKQKTGEVEKRDKPRPVIVRTKVSFKKELQKVKAASNLTDHGFGRILVESK